MTKYTIASKKNFIRWFLINFNVKQSESSKILNRIMSSDNLLEKVHFIEKAEDYKNAILIPTRCDESSDHLTYYKTDGSAMKEDERKMHVFLINNSDKGIYIELKFKNRHSYSEYVNVLESEKKVEGEKITDSSIADSLLENIKYNFNLQHLQTKIDESLINNNKEEFHILALEYNKLISSKPKVEYRIIKK